MGKSVGSINERLASQILIQILTGLAHAHSKQICHRDIKPENIMFDPATCHIKIIDFGFACSSKERLKVFCGTPSYMSPEIVSNEEYNGSAVDIWASGILLYLMLTGKLPFRA